MLYSIVATIARLAISLVQLLLIVRLILSFAPLPLSEQVVSFVFRFTEPLLRPAKALVRRFPRLYQLPFDLSVPITFFILGIVAWIL